MTCDRAGFFGGSDRGCGMDGVWKAGRSAGGKGWLRTSEARKPSLIPMPAWCIADEM